jgi:hypothetical protein
MFNPGIFQAQGHDARIQRFVLVSHRSAPTPKHETTHSSARMHTQAQGCAPPPQVAGLLCKNPRFLHEARWAGQEPGSSVS